MLYLLRLDLLVYFYLLSIPMDVFVSLRSFIQIIWLGCFYSNSYKVFHFYFNSFLLTSSAFGIINLVIDYSFYLVLIILPTNYLLLSKSYRL